MKSKYKINCYALKVGQVFSHPVCALNHKSAIDACKSLGYDLYLIGSYDIRLGRMKPSDPVLVWSFKKDTV